ncbi:PREDICTED: uncharacterized protein LOC108562868 [Nicrophorus vespilloides]|uniref:Uncharacterized protein LOC108562868 n=1 Tax=Nicrophorus vespilloides TaxID=110193 RepID=A0ABM1MQJ8_NICVS|nr:PREDICTED: uncharacterized protein LOC108562868 [Nicrophorus vespilloides]
MPVTQPPKEQIVEAEEVGEYQPAQAQRETTLTDHLNKKLLTSFLQRINQVQTAEPSVKDDSKSGEEEDSNFD